MYTLPHCVTRITITMITMQIHLKHILFDLIGQIKIVNINKKYKILLFIIICCYCWCCRLYIYIYMHIKM